MRKLTLTEIVLGSVGVIALIVLLLPAALFIWLLLRLENAHYHLSRWWAFKRGNR